MVKAYERALQKLWTGVCSIYVRETEVNPKNGRDETVEKVLAGRLPCRISFSSIASTQEDNDAALVQQSVKLFLSKDLSIPPGSKIIVMQEGRTAVYAKSGEAAVYRYHQEVPLELFKEYA